MNSILLCNHTFCSQYHINISKLSLPTKFKYQKCEHILLFVGFAPKQDKFACLMPCITSAILLLYYYFHILTDYAYLLRIFCHVDAP